MEASAGELTRGAALCREGGNRPIHASRRMSVCSQRNDSTGTGSQRPFWMDQRQPDPALTSGPESHCQA